MNNVVLMGRLTKEPEIKQSQGGKSYCNFSIAVKKRASKDEVDFINCIAWENVARVVGTYFSKGQRILLNGSISTNQYEKNGMTLTGFNVLVNNVEFIEYAHSDGSSNQKEEEEEEVEVMNYDEFPF